MITNALCMAVMVAVASAAVRLSKLPNIPQEFAHKKGCYIKEVNDVRPFNESVTPVGFCEAIRCLGRGIQYETCSPTRIDRPECFATERDYSRPYNQCCPQIRCDLGENLIAD